MKRLSLLKVLFTAFMVICVVMVGIQGNAFAATATGSKLTATVYGNIYTYVSQAVSDSNGVSARGTIGITPGSSVKTGYLGIDAKLYTTGGSLAVSSKMTYNDRDLSQYESWTVECQETTKVGTYFAKSDFKFYNGNGYNSYTSNASPNVQRSLVTIPNKPYEVNEDGLTYGSDYYANSIESSPDLIQAIGKNGVEGYVYSKDMNLDLNTLEAVQEYISSGQSDLTIPVYANDGVTIVDTFELNANLTIH